MKDWNPKLIMKDLERVNPVFYPKPVKEVEETANDGTKFRRYEPITDNFLDRDDLLKLYEQCGGLLHARNPYQPVKDLNKIKSEFISWISKIKTLLNKHTIVLFGEQLMVVGVMNTIPSGLPKAYLFEIASEDIHKKYLQD